MHTRHYYAQKRAQELLKIPWKLGIKFDRSPYHSVTGDKKYFQISKMTSERIKKREAGKIAQMITNLSAIRYGKSVMTVNAIIFLKKMVKFIKF